MDINGTLNRLIGGIEHNAKPIGALAGGYSYLRMGSDQPVAYVMDIINALIKDPHIPNISHMIESIANPVTNENKAVSNAVMAALAGYGAELLDVHPTVTRIGKFAKNAGTAALFATLAIIAVRFAGQFHSNAPTGVTGVRTGGSGSSGNSNYGY